MLCIALSSFKKGSGIAQAIALNDFMYSLRLIRALLGMPKPLCEDHQLLLKRTGCHAHSPPQGQLPVTRHNTCVPTDSHDIIDAEVTWVRRLRWKCPYLSASLPARPRGRACSGSMGIGNAPALRARTLSPFRSTTPKETVETLYR